MQPEKVARSACKTISFVSKIAKPIVWLLAVSTNGVMRLIGINPKQSQDGVTEDEIRMMVDIGEEEGAIASNEREMIENIFEFNNSSAEDVMTHRTDVTAIWIDDTPETIIAIIQESGLSRFPVYDEDLDDIIGVLNTREYLLNERSAHPLLLKEILRPTVFVPESVRTDVLFRSMQKNKTHIVVVVDEYGGMSGIITMEDLLEEIVGNIYDEFDPQAVQDIEQINDNLWRVSGGVELETLARAIGVEIPETDEYETVGGLVFSQMVSIPEDGSHPEFDVCGMHIKVEELVDRRVEWALISKLAPESAESTQDYSEDD